jgi:predicted aspartyl protease
MRLPIAACIALFAATSLHAQLPATQPTATQPIATQLQADADNLRYAQLTQDLESIPAGPIHDLYAGVLADRSSRFPEALNLLTPLAANTALTVEQRALILGSLADAHFKLFHYAQASAFYNQLFACCSSALPPSLLKDDQDDNALLKILTSAPPQTIDIPSSINIPTHTDALGSITADVTVNNITLPWVLDTGASLTVLSESFAHRLSLTALPGTAHTMGATGVENPLHAAILPTLTIGTATLHNVVALILPDANLTFATDEKHSSTISAILGLPVFQSLGIIRFSADHHFAAGPTLPVTGPSSPIYFDKLSPLVQAETTAGPRLFLFDSGANLTRLFAPFYLDFPNLFHHQKKGRTRSVGAGGTATDRVYILDSPRFGFAGSIVLLRHVPVTTTATGGIFDRYEGSFGRDLLAAVPGLTLDLTHDLLYLGDPQPPPHSAN